MSDELKPEVTRMALFHLQVCVPEGFTDEEVETFANEAQPAGTTHGWTIRRAGDPGGKKDPERNPCDTRVGCVHIVLVC